jgi:hypothetical protein
LELKGFFKCRSRTSIKICRPSRSKGGSSITKKPLCSRDEWIWKVSHINFLGDLVYSEFINGLAEVADIASDEELSKFFEFTSKSVNQQKTSFRPI